MIIIQAWQWDTDVPIKIPWGSAAVPELDFMPDTGTGCAVTPTLTDGTLTAQCPPQLLTSSRPIQIYARLGNTIDRVGMICIKPRPKPPDYIDTPEAVRTWEMLRADMGDLSGLETENKESLVAAINETAHRWGEEVSGATVGQIITVAAVDDAGRPTAWTPLTLTTETWSFTMEDGSEVTKEVYIR
ncbi:MAG: hypothetical protein IJY28_10915 [Clostridia bacterium]|nr:hypothetical protein [Clostridia bacterium]